MSHALPRWAVVHGRLTHAQHQQQLAGLHCWEVLIGVRQAAFIFLHGRDAHATPDSSSRWERKKVSVQDVVGPFQAAMRGIVYTFRTQRHLRIHIYVTLAVVLGAVFLNLRPREVLILLFMVTFVLVAEMFNSAIEATVDLVSPGYHPLAKFAKDISAGAVLITTVMAIVVGTMMVLGEEAWDRIRISLSSDSLGVPVASRLVIGLALLFMVVIVGKGLGKRGEVFRGGLVSGHAAFGFFMAGAIFFLSDKLLVSTIAILLALIIAQARWEAKIHTVFELALGATVGIVMAFLFFGLVPK